MLTSFGHLLKSARLERGLTQKQLADLVGVDGSYIARLEMDDRRPSRRVVLDLAKAMKMSAVESDRLLASAQHLPEGDLERLLSNSGVSMTHPVIQVVASALQDKDLSPKGREMLEQEITAYVGQRAQQIKDQERQRRAQVAEARAARG